MFRYTLVTLKTLENIEENGDGEKRLNSASVRGFDDDRGSHIGASKKETKCETCGKREHKQCPRKRFFEIVF